MSNLLVLGVYNIFVAWLLLSLSTTPDIHSPKMKADLDPPLNMYAAPGTAADENEPISGYDWPPAPETDEHGYRIREEPMGTKRKLKVVLMGAGASSLNFFKKTEEEMENLDVVCYEKNNDVGGTWLENRYPGMSAEVMSIFRANGLSGCACDIPSVNYQFSWKIKLWSHYYSYSPEIYEYFKGIYTENDFVNKYVKLRHKIEHVEWDDEAGVWRFKVRNLETDQVIDDAAEFFINAGGVLNTWKWPNIPVLEHGIDKRHVWSQDDVGS